MTWLASVTELSSKLGQRRGGRGCCSREQLCVWGPGHYREAVRDKIERIAAGGIHTGMCLKGAGTKIRKIDGEMKPVKQDNNPVAANSCEYEGAPKMLNEAEETS